MPVPVGGVLKVRVYLCHVMDGPVLGSSMIRLMLRMASGTGAFGSHRGIIASTGGLADRGTCLARSHLFQQWDELVPSSGSVSASNNFLVHSHPLRDGVQVTAIHEFEVTGNAGQVLWLATCVSPDMTLPSWHRDLVLPADRHIRGSWPMTNLKVGAGSLDVNPAFPIGARQCMFVCRRGGLDQSLFARRDWTSENGPDEFGSEEGNTGLYGVDCEYVMATTNSHTAAAYGWVRLAARNTGSPYFGAV